MLQQYFTPFSRYQCCRRSSHDSRDHQRMQCGHSPHDGSFKLRLGTTNTTCWTTTHLARLHCSTAVMDHCKLRGTESEHLHRLSSTIWLPRNFLPCHRPSYPSRVLPTNLQRYGDRLLSLRYSSWSTSWYVRSRFIRTWLTLAGPLIAGIVVTYANWRVILYIQAGMILLGLILSIIFLHEGGKSATVKSPTVVGILQSFNPGRVLVLFRYPDILLPVGSTDLQGTTC